jgi:hypothetical protein
MMVLGNKVICGYALFQMSHIVGHLKRYDFRKILPGWVEKRRTPRCLDYPVE